MLPSPLNKEKVIEKLAELEHQQWEKWSKDLFSQLEQVYSCINKGDLKQAKTILTHRGVRWKANWKPYDKLDEATKEFDREWARKSYEAISEDVAAAVALLKQTIHMSFHGDQNGRKIALTEYKIEQLINNAFVGLEDDNKVEGGKDGN